MNTLEMSLGIAIAIIVIAVATYFIWRQQVTLQSLRADAKVPLDQRRYLTSQCLRRVFGSCVLILVAIMLAGSLFLDYDPLGKPLEEVPLAEQAVAKDAVRFISIYWMTLLLLLMAVMTLAVVDLWATARHGVRQQRQLLQEHLDALEAELEEHQHRRTEMN